MHNGENAFDVLLYLYNQCKHHTKICVFCIEMNVNNSKFIKTNSPESRPARAGNNLQYLSAFNDVDAGFALCSRVVENGNETVTVEENGVVTSMTVNGQPQAIQYR